MKACVDNLGVRPQYFLVENDNVIFKKDEETKPGLVEVVEDIASQVKYLKSEVAELKRKKK